jgi:hypothetical protein
MQNGLRPLDYLQKTPASNLSYGILIARWEQSPKKTIWVVYFAKSGGVEHHAESLELAQKWVEEKLEDEGRSFRDADIYKIKKIVYWN